MRNFVRRFEVARREAYKKEIIPEPTSRIATHDGQGKTIAVKMPLIARHRLFFKLLFPRKTG